MIDLILAHRAQLAGLALLVLIVIALYVVLTREEREPDWIGRARRIRPRRTFLNVMTLCDRKPGVWFNVREYAVAVRAVPNPRRVFPRLLYEIRPWTNQSARRIRHDRRVVKSAKVPKR